MIVAQRAPDSPKLRLRPGIAARSKISASAKINSADGNSPNNKKAKAAKKFILINAGAAASAVR